MPLNDRSTSRSGRPWRRAAALLLSGLLAIGAPAKGQSVQALAHGWQLDRSRSDEVSVAIGRAVAPMNPIVRLVARRRLTALNPAFPTLRLVELPHDTIGITWGDNLEARAVPAADAAAYVDRAGERMTLRLTLSPAGAAWTMEEVYVTDDGTRTNRWTLLPDGALEVSVSVIGPRLPKPLSYRFVYVRPGSAT